MATNQISMGYCKMMAGYLGGIGAAVAYQMGAIGLALTAIGAVGCLWSMASGYNIVTYNRQILAQASLLFSPDMDDTDRSLIIEAVAAIPADERKQVIDLASRLILPRMSWRGRASLLKAIQRLPANQREQVVALASRLITQKMDGWDSSEIIDGVARIPANDREQVIALASPLITQDMDRDDRCSIIELIAKIPANEREQVIALASPLITQEIDAYDRYRIIDAVARIPANEREQVIALASLLITQEIDAYHRYRIIDAVARIPANERVQVINLASRLITQEMDGLDRYSIIEAVASIPANEHEQFIDLASRLITQEMDGWDRVKIIDAVARIPANERQQMIDLPSLPRLRNVDDIAIIHAFLIIPENERLQAKELVAPLIQTEMHIIDSMEIIAIVVKIPANEREQVIALASRVITQDVDGRRKVRIIDEIANIPANNRDQCIEQAIDLTSRMILLVPLDNGEEKSTKIIDCAKQLAQGDPNFSYEIGIQTIDLASQLIDPEMDELARENIVNAVYLAGNEREARVQRVAPQIAQDRHDGLLDQDIVHRMVVILETPLNQPIPPLHAEMAELAAQGQNEVDVHQGTRDAKTRRAIELLKEHQGPIESNTIDEAVGTFIQYLNDYKGKAEIRAKAQQALNGPHEAWPPLLNNHELHNIGGLRISGEELIARLWIFANEQKSETERENCHVGMIMKLSESIEFGSRVCPPGQTQRQVIAVLQGRLDGVNVDDVEIVRTKTLNEHTADFLSGQMTTTDRAKLMQAANAYLNDHPEEIKKENPDATPERFMAEIIRYADSMGLDSKQEQ
jgi:hypothetical protein